MNQALQLGFKTHIKLSRIRCSFAVGPRSLGIGRLAPLRGKVMGSKRRGFSNSSSISNQNVDKKLKAVIDNDNPIFDKPFLKDIKDDPGKIEAMTVQQLRTALRNAGIPAKGLKRDLVSTLQSYLAKEVDGESSLLENKQDPFKPNQSISMRMETRSVEEQVQDVNTISKVSKVQQSKRTVKHSQVKGETAEVDAKIVTLKQKLSGRTACSSGRKASLSKRKVSSEDVYSKDVSTENGVTLHVSQSEPWTILAHKKPQKGWIAYNPRTMRRPCPAGNSKFVKVLSWNVNGLRALLKLEGFSALELAKRENFDVLCLQETKLQEKDVESIKQSLIEGYENSFWTCSNSKLGYSGTAIISRIKPLSVRYGLGISDHDSEGRVVTAEFDSFYLLSVYVPNSGDGLRRLTYRITEWDPSLSNYLKELEKSKPVILTGDLNCAHEEIDIHDPAGNKRSAGFTIEERQSFGTNFLSRGFVDTFRKQNPGVVGYTYWGYRHGGRKTNKGWRLDYFLVSEAIADDVHDSYILPDVMGSDHCPIGLILKL